MDEWVARAKAGLARKSQPPTSNPGEVQEVKRAIESAKPTKSRCGFARFAPHHHSRETDLRGNTKLFPGSWRRPERNLRAQFYGGPDPPRNPNASQYSVVFRKPI